jgi:hypothetical protein
LRVDPLERNLILNHNHCAQGIAAIHHRLKRSLKVGQIQVAGDGEGLDHVVERGIGIELLPQPHQVLAARQVGAGE